jgi:hypothetical protein
MSRSLKPRMFVIEHVRAAQGSGTQMKYDRDYFDRLLRRGRYGKFAMRNTIFEGWKTVVRSHHYFRFGRSLCSNAILFANAPALPDGKVCSKCSQLRSAELQRSERAA